MRGAAAIVGACALSGGLASFGMTGAAAAAPATAAPTPAAPALTQLTSDVYQGLGASTDIGPANGAAPMTVGIGLQVDKAARDAAYAALFTPGTASFHQFYTPESFNQAFGISQAAAMRTRAYSTRDGLNIVYSSPDGSFVELAGTTAQVERTFNIAERSYFDSTAKTAYTANSSAPTVPSDVIAVSGLTSLTVARTHSTVASKAVHKNLSASAVPGVTPAQDTCAPMGAQCTGLLTPSDVRSVYQVPSTNLGAGQKVAIFGEGQLKPTIDDLRIFEDNNHFNLPQVPVRQVLVGDNLVDTAGATEWNLDSQAITGMAPNLQELDFYFGSSLSDQSITATYNAWANDPNGPLTGNSSFGGAEPLSQLGGFLEDMPLQQAAMEGRTMFVSSGDGGGSCLPGVNGVTNSGVPCVEYPSSSAYVVGVGGTIVYTQAVAGAQTVPAQRALEYSWTSSGGGMSQNFAAPAYQVAAFPGQTSNRCTTGPGVGQVCRGVPDVSALSGDIVTNGYTIVVGGMPTSGAGTSLSSPLWAGAWANVQAAYQPGVVCKNPNLVAASPGSNAGAGFAQPELYNVALNPTADVASFFDVGGTTNSIPSGNGQQVSLPRSLADPTGYDFVSGLGSPMLSGLINNLDCGHSAATTATVAPAGLNKMVTYGVTPPYNDPTVQGCTNNGQLTETPGDATIPGAPGAPYDLTRVSLTSDATSTTFAASARDLTTAAANDVDYAFEFTYGSASYAVSLDTGANPVAELYLLTITSTPVGLGAQAAPMALAALTPVVDPKTNTISVNMPFATFNSAAGPATPYGIGSQLNTISVFTNNGPAPAAIANDFNAAPVDQANFFQCPYNVTAATGSPTNALPEAPLGIALPLAGLGLVGGAFLTLRHRRRTA